MIINLISFSMLFDHTHIFASRDWTDGVSALRYDLSFLGPFRMCFDVLLPPQVW